MAGPGGAIAHQTPAGQFGGVYGLQNFTHSSPKCGICSKIMALYGAKKQTGFEPWDGMGARTRVQARPVWRWRCWEDHFGEAPLDRPWLIDF